MFKKSIALVVFISFLFSASNLFAQSCENAEALLACSFVAAENCRADAECESNLRQVITVQDVIEDASDACCSKSTTNARNGCLNKYRKRLTRGLLRLPSKIRAIMRESRKGVKALRTNDCSTGTLGEL